MRKKQYQTKELLNSFHLNGRTLGFQRNTKTNKQQQHNVPAGHILCQGSCGGHSSPYAVWSPVCALPFDDSAAVSCIPPAGLSSHLPACCVPDAVWQSGFEAGWWQTCHRLHDDAVATEDEENG